MNIQTYHTKKILSILVICILLSVSLFSFPKKAHAIIGVGDVVFDVPAEASLDLIVGSQAKQIAAPSIWDILRKEGIEPALQAAAEQFAIQLVQNITNSTISWINNGFKGPDGSSNPTFVSDFGKFLQNTGDQVLGSFINDSSLSFLCSPFKLQIQLALGLGPSTTFANRIGCTLTGALTNGKNAISSAQAGGWENWIQLTTQPQNNPIGAFLLAQSELNVRIAAKQSNANQELLHGSGALSLKQCTDTTYDPTTGVGTAGDSYIGTDFSANGPTTANSTTNNGGNVETNCTVETPGAVITNMLGFSATSDQRMGELRGALSNGIDSIMNALLNSLAQATINSIKNGILNTQSNNTANTNIQSQITSLQGQIQNQYNSTASDISSGNYNSDFTNALGNYDLSSGAGYGAGFTTPDSINGSAGISAGDPLAVPRSNALNRITTLLDGETNYQNTYVTASTTLAEAEAVFASSTVCNYQQNNPTAALRASEINANVISNIEGTPDSSRSVGTIPWSFPDIQALLDASNNNVDLLNTAQTAVSAVQANGSGSISDAMIPVNSTSFNTDPQRSILDNIKAWLTTMQKNYSTAQCPIDLTSVLAIQAPDIVATPLIALPAADVSYATPAPTAPAPVNKANGPYLTSASPSPIQTGNVLTLTGGQLIYDPTGKANGILIDGNLIASTSGATIQGLSLSFIMPPTVTPGEHSISIQNEAGVTNSLIITVSVIPQWVHCANEGAYCGFGFTGWGDTHTIRFGAYTGGYSYYVGNAFNNYSGSVSAGYKYKYKDETGGANCNTGTFGDPLAGVGKACDYWSGPTNTTPAHSDSCINDHC